MTMPDDDPIDPVAHRGSVWICGEGEQSLGLTLVSPCLHLLGALFRRVDRRLKCWIWNNVRAW